MKLISAAWDSGCRPPPVTPCMTRKKISQGRLGEISSRAKPKAWEKTPIQTGYVLSVNNEPSGDG